MSLWPFATVEQMEKREELIWSENPWTFPTPKTEDQILIPFLHHFFYLYTRNKEQGFYK